MKTQETQDVRVIGYRQPRREIFSAPFTYSVHQPTPKAAQRETRHPGLSQARSMQWRYRNGQAAYFTTSHIEPPEVGNANSGTATRPIPPADSFFEYAAPFQAALLVKAIEYRKKQMERWNFKREAKKAAEAIKAA